MVVARDAVSAGSTPQDLAETALRYSCACLSCPSAPPGDQMTTSTLRALTAALKVSPETRTRHVKSFVELAFHLME